MEIGNFLHSNGFFVFRARFKVSLESVGGDAKLVSNAAVVEVEST